MVFAFDLGEGAGIRLPARCTMAGVPSPSRKRRATLAFKAHIGWAYGVRSRSGRQCRDRRQAARDDARDLRGRRRLSRRPRARPVREGSPADDRRVRLPAKSLPARAQEVLGLTQSAVRARLDSAGAASGRPWATEQRECALAAWVALASLKQ